MPLSVGSRVGTYQVVSRLGEGGMGVVFRARDTRLDRDVAIKTLPEIFANDRDRLERFEREAQVLASLNHPHIAQIYGFEQSAGQSYIVMELVEGETLADRLAHGSIPVEETLSIAGEIAAALEAAHEKGVVHRDLKPGNIKLTRDGQIKVLDFGLAKAMSEEAHAPLVSHSPTISPAATQAGVILGTAAYMAPEQAKGRAVDRRADIWAFGVVVFETLTGRTLYSGDTISETLAQVMMTEPDWQSLPHSAPPALVQLLRRCLVKDPRNRLQAIGDARIEIDSIRAGRSDSPAAASATASPGRVLGWSLLSLAIGAALGAAALWLWPRETAAPASASRWSLRLADGDRVAFGRLTGLGIGRPAVAVSPDDRHIAYVVERGDQTQIHLRSMSEFEGEPIPGTEGGSQPFFSPDGQWLGFITETKLKKVFLQGGSPVTLCDAVHVYGASWGDDDRIYFGDREANALTRIAASGGAPEVIANSSAIGVQLFWPHVLPGGRAILFSSLFPGTIRVLSLQDRSHHPLITGTSAVYVPTGHIVFSRGSDVLAARFDLDRLAVTGAAVPVLQNVRTEALDAGQFSISRRGTLAYVSGGFARFANLVWIDRRGHETAVNVPPLVYGSFALSPDGRRIAIVVPAQGEGQTDDLWVYDLERDTRTRLASRASNPQWARDGKSVILGLEQNGIPNLHRQAADGTGIAERLADSRYAQIPQTVSPDGNTIVYSETNARGDRDLWVLRLDGDRTPKPLLQTPVREVFAALSPDGRWLAYVTDASGRYEVYLMPASGTGDRQQVSAEGGEEPRWSARNELFYRNGQKWMSVSIAPGPAFAVGRPQMLFEGPFPNVPGYSYDVAEDGQRFLIAREAMPGNARDIRVVVNWFDDLTRRMAAAAGK